MNRTNIICFALLIVTGANAGCISSPESSPGNDTGVTVISVIILATSDIIVINENQELGG